MGRKRMQMIDDLQENQKYRSLKVEAQDQRAWKQILGEKNE